MNTLTIVNKTIQVKEWNGQRVVTFRDIDTVHDRPEGTARRNFNANREHFIEGEDYFEIQPNDIRMLGLERPQGGTAASMTLLTESGYLMLVKSFTDDTAWSVQRMLVNCYFRVKAEAEPNPALTPELQALKHVLDAMTRSQLEQAELKRRVDANAVNIEATQGALTTMRETLVRRDDDWRRWAKATFDAAVEASAT